MIPPEIENWLKSSISGIVVLGAFGSILAVVALWALKRLLSFAWRGVKWLLPTLSAAASGFYKTRKSKILFRSAYRIVHAKKIGIEAVTSLLLYHALLAIIGFGISAFSFGILGYLSLRDGTIGYNPRLLYLSTSGVFGLLYSVRHFIPIWLEASVVIARAKKDDHRFNEVRSEVEQKGSVPKPGKKNTDGENEAHKAL